MKVIFPNISTLDLNENIHYIILKKAVNLGTANININYTTLIHIMNNERLICQICGN
jgi:hypothetical protein